MTLKPVKVLFGLDQETVTDDSVTLLSTISVAGSGPGETQRRVSACFGFVCVKPDLYSTILRKVLYVGYAQPSL